MYINIVFLFKETCEDVLACLLLSVIDVARSQ